MNDFIKEGLKNLDNQALYDLVKDCELRIGSHVAGGFPNEGYVKKQQSIIEAEQNELNKRNQ